MHGALSSILTIARRPELFNNHNFVRGNTPCARRAASHQMGMHMQGSVGTVFIDRIVLVSVITTVTARTHVGVGHP
jgi:hypothetical protein